MGNGNARALLAEYRRTVNAFSQLLSEWNDEKANQPLPTAPDKSCLSAIKEGIRTNYEYISWIQKSAALPRLSPPNFVEKLESADLKTVKTVLNFLGPLASECLSGLTNEQLQYRPVRDYTLEQMLEHAIVSVWLQIGQAERY